MKKASLLLITAIVLWGCSKIREGKIINIPDANFKEYLLEEYDDDNNGEISEKEAERVTYIDVYNRGIVSLEGIQHFRNIQMLSCTDNKLTALDLSNNTQLARLYCHNNRLTALNLSNNRRLTKLECYSNRLTALDISNNRLLTELHCHNNPGTNGIFPVSAWFDNFSVPKNRFTIFTTGSWSYDDKIVWIDYQEVKQDVETTE